MKKIILIVGMVLMYVMGTSQAISQRGTSAVTVQDARLFAQYNFRPPAFQDTTAANLQIGLDSCGALIFSRDINAYYFRACSPKRWLKVGGSAQTDSAYVTSAAISNNAFILCRSSGTCDTILLVDTLIPRPISYDTRLVSGNAVWDTLLKYNVTNCSYFILGNFYTSLATTVTLAPADSSNPRIDVIYLDTLGNVGVLTGIPSPDPIKPVVNPLSQIELTHINIDAQGTSPAGVGKQIVYNENLQVPTEWNTPTSISTANYDYLISPYIGLKSMNSTSSYGGAGSGVVQFNNSHNVNADTCALLSMYVLQNGVVIGVIENTGSGTIRTSPSFYVQLLKAGVAVTSRIGITDGFYGYAIQNVGAYQNIVVPFTDFTFANSLDKTFDEIYITNVAVTKSTVQFDYITIQKGGNLPPVISNYWSLSGNDNSSIPKAKLGTTSKNVLSIVTNDVERINIAEDGLITIPNINTTSDTTEYKPLSIGSTGEVSKMTSWGNNTVYTINPIMSMVSNDSNIIYFNPDTANVWRGGGSGTIPTLQQVLDNNHNLVSEINLQGTLSGDGSTLTSNVNAFGGNAASQVYNGVTDMNAFGNSAGYYYGAYSGSSHSNINLFGNYAGEEAFGNNINGLGYYSTRANVGNDVNAMGYYSAQNNQGSNVNAFGNGAGNNNNYSDVNLFGQGATATAGNQIVFAGSGGSIQSIIQQPSTTQTYTLPDATGVLPLSVNGYTANSVGAITVPLGGSGTVTDISQGYGITASPTNPITVSGTIEVDTVTLSGKYLRINDTTAMLTPYLRKVDTSSLSSRIDLRVKYSDTSSMLLPYLRKIDTTNRFVNNVTKKNDSTITVFKGSTSTDIVLPRGSAGSSGTVTSVAALSLGTTGTDLNSTVANSTTTPVITLNVPDASATARGVVTIGTQTFEGSKTFSSDIIVANFITVGKGSGTPSLGLNSNTAFGRGALFSNTTGGGNTAMGNGAGGNITTGYQNTNIGEGSGSITTGNDNTFIGYFAGYNVDTGYRNIAIGASSLSSQVVGYSKAGKDNIAIGYKANFGKGGDNNIVIGNKSLFDTSNLGSYNTIIGTNVSYPFANNNVIIADGQANIRFKDDNTNTILPRLAGTGTRMVTAGTNGELSTQTIPSGGTAYIDSIYRTAGKDSFFYKKNGNTYAIKDSVGTNPAPVGYYGAFSDTTSQTAVAINTGYAMKFALNDITPNGISMLVNGGGNKTRITFANTGVYNLQWSAQFTSIDNAENDVSVWLRKNGTDVVGSRGLVSVPKKLGLISGHALPSWNFVLSVVAGEYYEFVWSTSNTNVSIDALPLTAYAPSTASTILTVTQQSGIMAGTGITAINSLTAAAQTMVTGTDSSDFKIVSTGTSHTFNLPTASASKRGALSSTDWNTFNNKASGDTTSLYLISDATTSNLTATNTNLTFAIPANGTYRIMIAGTASKAVAATGLKLAIGAPTGCTIKAVQMSGGAVLSTAMTNSIITAVNTLGATFATGIATEVPFRIEGTIINGSTAGNIILQFASVVSNIATIYAGTVMQLTKSKGL